jgi:hypothetical protein
MQEVSGSIPLGSTIFPSKAPDISAFFVRGFSSAAQTAAVFPAKIPCCDPRPWAVLIASPPFPLSNARPAMSGHFSLKAGSGIQALWLRSYRFWRPHSFLKKGTAIRRSGVLRGGETRGVTSISEFLTKTLLNLVSHAFTQFPTKPLKN